MLFKSRILLKGRILTFVSFTLSSFWLMLQPERKDKAVSRQFAICPPWRRMPSMANIPTSVTHNLSLDKGWFDNTFSKFLSLSFRLVVRDVLQETSTRHVAVGPEPGVLLSCAENLFCLVWLLDFPRQDRVTHQLRDPWVTCVLVLFVVLSCWTIAMMHPCKRLALWQHSRKESGASEWVIAPHTSTLEVRQEISEQWAGASCHWMPRQRHCEQSPAFDGSFWVSLVQKDCVPACRCDVRICWLSTPEWSLQK